MVKNGVLVRYEVVSYSPDRPQLRTRRPRKLPWPASRLTDLRPAIMAMAELSGVRATVLVRAAVVNWLVVEHERMFPGVVSPWHDEAGIEPRSARRAAEGAGGEAW